MQGQKFGSGRVRGKGSGKVELQVQLGVSVTGIGRTVGTSYNCYESTSNGRGEGLETVSLMGKARAYLEGLHKVCRNMQHLLALAACHRAD